MMGTWTLWVLELEALFYVACAFLWPGASIVESGTPPRGFDPVLGDNACYLVVTVVSLGILFHFDFNIHKEFIKSSLVFVGPRGFKVHTPCSTNHTEP